MQSPHNAIAGGGFFEHYTELPVSLAWSAFGEKNGAASLEATRQRIGRLRSESPKPWDDYTIGCILLVEPFFWPQDGWIPQPEDWKPMIVRGKQYDLTRGIGRKIWAAVVERLEHDGSISVPTGAPAGAETPVPEIPGGFGDPVVRPRRVGQGTFRVVVTDVYRRRCAVTGEKALPVLDAAHIRPFSQEREHYVSNGILLRSDVHRLFDSGYMTVTPEYRAEVSDRIHEDFDDGENYRKMHGSKIRVPERAELKPDPEFLRWHNENRYRG